MSRTTKVKTKRSKYQKFTGGLSYVKNKAKSAAKGAFNRLTGARTKQPLSERIPALSAKMTLRRTNLEEVNANIRGYMEDTNLAPTTPLFLMEGEGVTTVHYNDDTGPGMLVIVSGARPKGSTEIQELLLARIHKVIQDEGQAFPQSIRIEGLGTEAATDTIDKLTGISADFRDKRYRFTQQAREDEVLRYTVQEFNKLLIDGSPFWVSEEKIKNHVRKLTLIDEEGKVSYFKPVQRGETETDLPEKAKAIGVTVADPGYDKREVAAARLGALIFGDRYPDTTFATYQLDGQETDGHNQQEAPGQMASSKVSFDVEPFGLGTGYTSDENFKKQLVTLQAFDYLIGNIDRHLENYFIHDTQDGSLVIPIDSELSFPNIPVEQLQGLEGSRFEGLPSAYTDEVKRALEQMDDAWIEENLAPILDAQQLAQFKDRLAKMKADVAEKEGADFAPAASYMRFIFE